MDLSSLQSELDWENPTSQFCQEMRVQAIKQSVGITFAVDDVDPATELLTECRTHEAIRELIGDIESCHDYHGTVVEEIDYQPLLAAVSTAFDEHRPLVLTPDTVWITITQGIAHHMAIHGERLRSSLVSHQGKLDLEFECYDWVEGSPENPWPEAFASWADQIRDHVGSHIHDILICDFTTSGPIERAASQIVMMDIFERYFHYVSYAACGIPSVTLEGTTADWERLAKKVSGLRVSDIDWWLDHLEPICQQFVQASRGDIDAEHWQSICKIRRRYGGSIINGWVAKLFPYLRAFADGPCTRRNEIFETGEGFSAFSAPSGLSHVPFTWRNLQTGRERSMEAIGGLIGVSQDPETLALRPKVGWAIRETEKMDQLLSRLSKDHITFPGIQLEKNEDLPPDLCKFYHRSNGAELFGAGTSANYKLVAMGEITPLDWGELPQDRGNARGPEGRIWHRFAWLADGSWLAINRDPNLHKLLRNNESLRERWFKRDLTPFCHVSLNSQGQVGQNSVIALSFTELLERMLNSGGKPFWLDPGFVSYGDAEEFTRRS